jgi:hypothetical protein
VTLDGEEQANGAIVLRDDGREHAVEVRVGHALESFASRSAGEFAESLGNHTA